jgi:hypothetical protein
MQICRPSCELYARDFRPLHCPSENIATATCMLQISWAIYGFHSITSFFSYQRSILASTVVLATQMHGFAAVSIISDDQRLWFWSQEGKEEEQKKKKLASTKVLFGVRQAMMVWSHHLSARKAASCMAVGISQERLVVVGFEFDLWSHPVRSKNRTILHQSSAIA